MVRGWTARTAAALPVAVAILTACSAQQPASDTLPTASTASSTTAEALPPLGPADFPVPDEARRKTPEGALEFTRYYVKLLEHIGNGDLDPQPLIDLSFNCSHCTRVAESLANDRAAGYTYGGISVTFQGYGPGILDGDEAEVGFVYAQSGLTVYDASGQVVESESAAPTGDLQSGALLMWRDDLQSWLVISMTIG